MTALFALTNTLDETQSYVQGWRLWRDGENVAIAFADDWTLEQAQYWATSSVRRMTSREVAWHVDPSGCRWLSEEIA